MVHGKSHTLIHRDTLTHSRACRSPIIGTHMLVTGAEANPLRSNRTPNVHRRLRGVCVFVLFCPLCFANATPLDHTHTLPLGRGRGRREVREGSYYGTHTHAHSLTNSCAHTQTRKGTRTESDFRTVKTSLSVTHMHGRAHTSSDRRVE